MIVNELKLVYNLKSMPVCAKNMTAKIVYIFNILYVILHALKQ